MFFNIQSLLHFQIIASIKSHFLLYRQLAEKHQVLMRKYDQETKALKRLSMNNEELAWRLSMGSNDGDNVPQTGGGDSPSPAGSSSRTSSVSDSAVLRLKSPSQHVRSSSASSPIQPVHVRTSSISSPSQGQPSSPVSPRQKNLPKTQLIRTGTYEVLNKDDLGGKKSGK